MSLTLELEELGSRLFRKTISNGGIRKFTKSALSDSKDDEGNIIGKIWNGINRFGNSLMSQTLSLLGSGFQFSWTALWSACVSGASFLWNFNWNASDAELDSQINSSFSGLAGSLGGTLGNALGYLVCGAIPGAILFTFNEPLGVHVLEQVGEEALDEIARNVANLIKVTATSVTKAAAIYAYKNIRKLWREPDSAFVQKLKASGIVDQAKIDKALAYRNKPWSFAQKTEEGLNQFQMSFGEILLKSL